MNRFRTKRGGLLGVLLCCCLLSALFAGCAPTYQNGAKQVLRRLDIDAAVAADGSMEVTQHWEIDLANRWRDDRPFFVTFRQDPDQCDALDRFSVYDADRGVAYRYEPVADSEPRPAPQEDTYYLFSSGDKTELGFYIPPMEQGVRRFDITYRAANMMQICQDTAVFSWQFAGEGLPFPIEELHCTISFPQGALPQDLRAWLHATAQASALTIESGSNVSFTLQGNPSGAVAEPRICLPVSLFPNATRHKNEAVLEQITAEEQQRAQDEKAAQHKAYLARIADGIAGASLMVLGVGAAVILHLKNRRFPVSVPEYIRDIPKGETPAAMAPLFYYYQGGVGEKEKDRVLSASILYLAHAKCLSMTAQEENKLLLTPVLGKESAALPKNEQALLQLFAAVAADYGGHFTMEQLQSYAADHFREVDSALSRFFSRAQKQAAGKRYFRRSAAPFAILGLCTAFLLLLISMVTKEFSFVLTIAGAFAAALALALLAPRRPRLTAQGERDYMVWKGLQKFLLDFSNRKDCGVQQPELLEDYLVYAAAMGSSEEVMEQLTLCCPQLYDTHYMHTNYYGMPLDYMMLYRALGTGQSFTADLSHRCSALRAALTALAHPSASAGGGAGGGVGGNGMDGSGSGSGSGSAGNGAGDGGAGAH